VFYVHAAARPPLARGQEQYCPILSRDRRLIRRIFTPHIHFLKRNNLSNWAALSRSS
jgi:hypothetical protein